MKVGNPERRNRRLGNINGILGPAGTGGQTRGHATARMNTPSRKNTRDREGHVATWGGPDAVGRGTTSGGAAAPRRSAAKRWGRVIARRQGCRRRGLRWRPEGAGRGRDRDPRAGAGDGRGSGGSPGDPQWLRSGASAPHSADTRARTSPALTRCHSTPLAHSYAFCRLNHSLC